MRHFAAALVLGVAWSGMALADPKPVTQPTRDVEVVYSIPRGDQQIPERSRFQGSTGRQRLDAPNGSGTYMLSDPTGGTVTMVSPAEKKVIELTRPRGPLNGGPGTFKKLGQMTVVGLACTEWLVTPEQTPGAVPNEICLTDDGVMLNLRVGDQQRAQASKVTYAPIDAALFAVPTDYAHVATQPPAAAH